MLTDALTPISLSRSTRPMLSFACGWCEPMPPSEKVEFWREIIDSLSDALIVLGPGHWT